MKHGQSPYRIGGFSQVSNVKKDSKCERLDSLQKYRMPCQTQRTINDFSAQKHKYIPNNQTAIEYKLRFQQLNKSAHKNYKTKNKHIPLPQNFRVQNMDLLNTRQNKTPCLNGLHNLLNQVTQRYASGEGRVKTPSNRAFQGGSNVLKGQEDYELMKRRRQQANDMIESFVSSISKQIDKKLQSNKSAADIFHSTHKRTNSNSNKDEERYRQHNNKGVTLLNKHFEASTGKHQEKSRQKSVKKSLIFQQEEQFSISTNFTFEAKPLELSDFIILKEVESGRTGKVYRCIHRSTFALYALKTIKKSLIKNLDQSRFISQIKIQMFIKHPNIVALYGFFSDEQNVYLIMQYCQGGNLFDYVKGPGLTSQKVVAGWMRDTLKALTYLHDLKIVHRDIKPQNIILSCGVAKLCDFGCAAVCTDRRSTHIGTFDYLAPQMLKQQQYDENVDVWGLGIMTYQLLIGKAPFYHISKQITVQKILKQQIQFPKTMSKQGQSFINMLLIREPKQRCSARVMQHHSFISINCPQFSLHH